MSAGGDLAATADLSAVREDAVHGSYCPKMCNFACPVAAATGREAFTPWGLHVTVAELATARREPDGSTYAALVGCTGCHACMDACLYDQDVPAQVRAARATHDLDAHPAVRGVVGALTVGRSPYGTERPDASGADGAPDVQVVAGCRDEPELLDAVTTLFRAAGRAVRAVVPQGCCGALATDLGQGAVADDLRADLSDRLDRDLPTVATDPHCLPVLRTLVDAPVRGSVAELDTLLQEGSLRFPDRPGPTVTYHDPCLSARDEDEVPPPRRLLQAAGVEVREPRQHGRGTACSGAGMGMDLLDPDSAGAVAARRAGQLGRDRAVVTACSRARAQLSAAGCDVRDVHVVLADRLRGEGAP